MPTPDPVVITTWLHQRGPTPINEIAAHFGTTTHVVDAFTATGDVPKALVLAESAPNNGTGLTLEAAAEAVAQVWQQILDDARVADMSVPTTLSVSLYDRHRRPHDPSPASITSRHGWHVVCASAEVPAGAGRPSYTRRWATDDLLRWVAFYARTMIVRDERITFDGYDRWRVSAGQAGVPSGALVRTRLRGDGYYRWADIVAAALRVHPGSVAV